MEKVLTVIFAVLLIALCVALSVLYVGLLYWIVCWAFHLTFSWRICIGVWAVLALLKGISSTTVNAK